MTPISEPWKTETECPRKKDKEKLVLYKNKELSKLKKDIYVRAKKNWLLSIKKHFRRKSLLGKSKK
jgi:hypothetical protein